ncbi:MAG: ATP-binding protein, partial [Planctomycetes bacterium]|nr:ATP-binding protein [Planctomycetota bacterium]
PPPLVRIHHCTSQPYRFFGRTAELALLDQALAPGGPSLVALIGPGGQGKTAIVQHWLEQVLAQPGAVRGIFLWSFYRGKDVDLCLRELYAFTAGLIHLPDVSAAYCVDHLLPLLRAQPWVLILDGTEVVQYEAGPWFGRCVHPELGRLLEEVASAPMPGVLVLTSRFPLPELRYRPHARLLSLSGLDAGSARALLRSLGVRGSDHDLDEAAAFCGNHAKAVELLATYLVRFRDGEARQHRTLPETPPLENSSDEEHKVTRVLSAFQSALSAEAKDILALATAFWEPPAEAQVLDYLASAPVHHLLHETWGRTYPPFTQRGPSWLAETLQELVALRLLERVGRQPADAGVVLDAHPLVRRTFEHVLGTAGRRQSAQARAGFLSGRPDRRRAATLEEARAEVELFHAYADAGLWQEADRTLAGLDKPRYRFLAPAFERDLLLRFFPGGDWHRRPLWSGFHHDRSLAICLELLGSYDEALAAYREEDAPLRGDALIALGRLEPLLEEQRPPHPWQMLWQAYRAHALCLAGRTTEAVALARALVPVDVYEWTHVFECLLRTGQLAVLDMHSFLYRPPHTTEPRWQDLARQRMRADYLRATTTPVPAKLGSLYPNLLEAYDQGGLPYERTLTRLSYSRWLLARNELSEARTVNAVVLDVARRQGMRIMEADAWELEAEMDRLQRDQAPAEKAAGEAARLRREVGYQGPSRP